jgi:hypothetical protein
MVGILGVLMGGALADRSDYSPHRAIEMLLKVILTQSALMEDP